MARILGATHGQLQAELLTPLLARGMSILRRRGEIPDIQVDGRTVDLRYRSPLAEAQNRAEAQSALSWIKTVAEMGPEGLSVVYMPAFARWLAAKMSVPGELLRLPEPTLTTGANDTDHLAQMAAALSPLIEGSAVNAG